MCQNLLSTSLQRDTSRKESLYYWNRISIIPAKKKKKSNRCVAQVIVLSYG